MNGYLVFDSKSGKYDLSEQMKDSYRIRGSDEAKEAKNTIQTGLQMDEKKDKSFQPVYVKSGNEKISMEPDEGLHALELEVKNDPQTIEKQVGESENVPEKKSGQEIKGKGKVNKQNIQRNAYKDTANTVKNSGGKGKKDVSIGNDNVGIFERLVLKFAHSLSYFSFLIASVADLFLSVFFYYSLGYDAVSQIALSLWGLVTIGAKLYAWSYKKYILGVWCAVLSVFASVSIFLAVIDTQATQTEQNNNQVSVSTQIDGRITALEADRKALVTRRDSLPPDYTSAVQKLNSDIKELDKQLGELYNKKMAPESIATVSHKEIKLSAWTVFKQITGIKWNEPDHVVAFFFILLLAGLLDYVIFVVTPRQVRNDGHV